MIFFFDETITPEASIPTLNARLSKPGIVDAASQPLDLIFRTPSQSDNPLSDFPAEYIDQDPVGNWTFKLLASENQDPVSGGSKALSGLIDILLVIEYEFQNP